MANLIQSYRRFRFLVRNVRWVELAVSALIVIGAHQMGHLDFALTPVLIVFGLGFVWNWAFWYAGRRHLLHERGPAGARLLVWSSIVADAVTNLLIIAFTGATASPFLFLLVFPVIYSTVALESGRAPYAVAAGSALGLAAIWGMDNAGSIPHVAAYPPDIDTLFMSPRAALGVCLSTGALLMLLVRLIRFAQPSLAVFQDRLDDGHFRLQTVTPDMIPEFDLEELEVVGPEDLLEEAVQKLTRRADVAFGAAVILPSGEDTIGGEAGEAWHGGLTWQRVVSTTSRQVIPTWTEFDFQQSELFEEVARTGAEDLYEGPFEVLRENGLFTHFDDADTYLATAIAQSDRPVMILLVGLRQPVDDREGLALHLLTIAAQLKPLLIAEFRMSQMRREVSRLHQDNESLLRANKLQSDFVSIASHELKTPLASIGAYAEALYGHADVPEFPERREFLGVIRHENDRLLRMVNRILDFSQVEFGNRSLKRRSMKITDLLDDTLRALAPQSTARDQRFEVDFPEGVPAVEVDPDLMKQVFVNLVGNAIKYGPEGGRILIEGRERATTVEVSVRDEGQGIPESEVANVFRQFYRVKSEGEDLPEGSGLGLTIVRNIIEMHGGRIEVDGGEGTGATFRLQLPKHQSENDDQMTVLGDLGRRAEFRELIRLYVRMVADYMDCKIVSLMLLSANRSELAVQVAYGLDDDIVRESRRPVGEGVSGRVVKAGRPLLVEDVTKEQSIEIEHRPQYETKSLISVPMEVDGEVVGVVNCNNKVSGDAFDAEDLALLSTLSQRFSSAIERALRVDNTREEIEKTIAAIEALVRLRDSGGASSRRAARLAMDLGRRMGIDQRGVLALQYACIIHDVGMVEIDASLLENSGPLTPDVLERLRRHPSRSVELIKPFLSADELGRAIRHHHERFDGTGYPEGLAGEAIPLSARILAVIDAYESMTSERPWRRARRPSEAASELMTHSGTQFDRRVVEAFLDVLAENAELGRTEYLHARKEDPECLHPLSS
jgi:signal transduction histidine kinase/HD-GYP domain-containing protein (c-di-GMP phosphodiesterase class II)